MEPPWSLFCLVPQSCGRPGCGRSQPGFSGGTWCYEETFDYQHAESALLYLLGDSELGVQN